jgi:hypothetical protein
LSFRAQPFVIPSAALCHSERSEESLPASTSYPPGYTAFDFQITNYKLPITIPP